MTTITFADKTKLEIISSQGAPQFIRGAMRDILTFTVDPEIAGTEELHDIFTDEAKTAFFEIEITEKNEDGKETVNRGVYEGYTVYLSAGNEVRDVAKETTTVEKPEIYEVNIVKIGQITWWEQELLRGN
ncbi:MAG: hypothetical protein LBC82_01230 [Oscillospiraceae bacterium]|jgi:hypothetical protein|nr:hypothetical protein [Oscillospiraceae bacterium]